MIGGIRLKVCGLRSLVDAEAADEVGADYLGFILHPASPRYVPLEQFTALRARLPVRRTVAVTVEPEPGRLSELRAVGFDFFQVHFRPETPRTRIEVWAGESGPDRLWLAPRLAPGAALDPGWLAVARTLLLDTFQPAGFGGSGRTGDWAFFRRCREEHPAHHWILAGGLGPENIGAALSATGACWVDVNSGVESAPGVKDRALLTRLAAALRDRA